MYLWIRKFPRNVGHHQDTDSRCGLRIATGYPLTEISALQMFKFPCSLIQEVLRMKKLDFVLRVFFASLNVAKFILLVLGVILVS